MKSKQNDHHQLNLKSRNSAENQHIKPLRFSTFLNSFSSLIFLLNGSSEPNRIQAKKPEKFLNQERKSLKLKELNIFLEAHIYAKEKEKHDGT